MKAILVTGALFGASGVAFGAFGAHALDGRLSPRALGWYETAVTYHAGHALALLACGLLGVLVDWRDTPAHERADTRSGRQGGTQSGTQGGGRGAAKAYVLAGIAFTLGIVLFSGSLYTMAFTGWTRLGMITPLGGLALIVGWLMLALAAARLPPP